MRSPTRSRERPLSAALLAVAMVVLGQALQVNNGNLAPAALVEVLVALGLCLTAIVAWPALHLGKRGTLLVAILAAGLGLQLWQLATAPLGGRGPPTLTGTADVTFRVVLVAAGVLAMAGLAERPLLGRFHMAVVLVVVFVAGAYLITLAPEPHIDVYIFQRDGIDWLLLGENPYTVTYRNIYPNNTRLYGPGVVVDGRVGFYPYPPLTLLLGMPGRLLGDVRYALLAATVLAAGLIAHARPGRLARGAAALLLFTPRVFFILQESWTEPFVLLMLAATVFAALRAPRLLALCLGLFLASKQYAPLAAPLVLLLVDGDWRRFLRLVGAAAAVALVVTLPLFLWDPASAFDDIFLLQFRQPFRVDALSVLAWVKAGGGEVPGPWVSFAALATGLALALWRAPRQPSAFAAGIALTFLGFFVTNKQAFCNYYFFALGAIACALGAIAEPRAAPGRRRRAVTKAIW
jgi:hypothetical protein